MSVAIESQRLITVSLGKISQSRGQRGGINLHKNLLVATVLHKARTAYMIETFNFQQQQQLELEQQKRRDEEILRLKQQQQNQTPQQSEEADLCSLDQECEISSPDSELGHCSPSARVQSSSARVESSTAADSELGQSTARVESSTLPNTVTFSSSAADVSSSTLCDQSELTATVDVPVGQQVQMTKESPDTILTPQCIYVSPEPAMTLQCELSYSINKENDTPDDNQNNSQNIDHMEASNKLSQEASLGLSALDQSPPTMSAMTTCTGGVLKRRRDNTNSYCTDASVCKKARIVLDSSSSSVGKPFFSSFTSEISDYSPETSDYSLEDVESDSDMCSSASKHTDSTQICNLVNIFNSGLSGLCAGELTPDYDSDFEATSPPQYTTLTQLRPDSTQNKANFPRNVSESSLLCSTEVGRLDSLSSAIVLSA